MSFYLAFLTNRMNKNVYIVLSVSFVSNKKNLVFSLGTCTDHVDNYTCNCHVGFTGPHCDIKIADCTIDSCYPKVTCFKNSDTISCGPCPLGFSGDGKNCEGDYKNKKIGNIM